MNFTGVIVGLATFLIIGVFHPIVIKAEYYLGTKCWWIFLLLGIAGVTTSIFVADIIFYRDDNVASLSYAATVKIVWHRYRRVCLRR